MGMMEVSKASLCVISHRKFRKRLWMVLCRLGTLKRVCAMAVSYTHLDVYKRQVLSFMMAVTALSLPSLIMLRKAVKPKLLLTFTVIVTVGITFIGYLFNACSFMF